MKRILYIVIVLSIVLAGCASTFNFGKEEAAPRLTVEFPPYTVPPNFIPQTVIITALGDSLSQGVGDTENRGGYAGRLALEMAEWPGVEGIALENTAKRGRRSDQLLALFQQGKLSGPLLASDYIFMTIGGNDVMRIVKRDLFSLNVDAFSEEMVFYQKRFETIYASIRSLNPSAPLIVIGLYNPFSLVTDEVKEFDEIIASYNGVMEETLEDDPHACFVPVSDLFVGNDNLVYHTDFFHPNSKGYDLMAERVSETMGDCGISFQE
ncbi:GDSL-type esterase/lipase family protein [Planococcus maritimus]|uniref:GDSL-type esterase/lipase family protein n=1 Tax=Planococcus maritimus TaxID=192421 RepID=UPI003139DB31